MKKVYAMWIGGIVLVIGLFLFVKYYSEESQNNLQREWEAAYGFKHGSVYVLAGQAAPIFTWMGVEKLTTPKNKKTGEDKNYRFGYGYYDANKNNLIDPDEKKLGKKYFEIGPYTMYVYLNTGRNQFADKQPKQ